MISFMLWCLFVGRLNCILSCSCMGIEHDYDFVSVKKICRFLSLFFVYIFEFV